jgi:hypothetical protein
MVTGLCTDSYAIIELGMVDDIIKDKENSRRKMLEQAAGITIYKTRKKEAKLKLDAAEQDLARIEDLLFEINNQLKSLENQAKKAEKYFEIKKDYKEVSIELAKAALEGFNITYRDLNQQQQEEDMNSLRNILESLMTLSFDQEEVMQRFTKVADSDPSYRRYGRKQRMLIDETTVVRDSLLALAKRQPKIAAFVDKELNDIKNNHALCVEDIDEHRKRDLGVHQQKVMTAYNNLALLLNESLQSMQQQMQNSKPGQGSCNKPGGKGQPKPGPSMSSGDMKQMLKKQLEQMQKGPHPNGNKPGDKPGEKQGEGGMGMPGLGNKEIAKMAAEQTAIRQRLEQLRNEMNKEGQGKGNKLNPLIKELEEQEKEIINKKFSNETIKRQKDILTRLLESEKAIMERGFEEKRESESGKNQNYSNQIRFDEYNRQKLRQIELLRSVDPVYKKYYKDKANEYFNRGL